MIEIKIISNELLINKEGPKILSFLLICVPSILLLIDYLKNLIKKQ